MNSERILECTKLSKEILKNFEMSELPINNIILKCLRLCRLMNDTDGISLFQFESSGYTSTPDGIPLDAWEIAKLAGRVYKKRKY